MDLTLTRTQKDKIALPTWMIDALALYEGEQIQAVIYNSEVRISRKHPLSSATIDDSHHHSETERSLEQTVARIRSRPYNPKLVRPAAKTAEEVMTDLAARLGEDAEITPEEWDRLWAKFEADLKVIER